MKQKQLLFVSFLFIAGFISLVFPLVLGPVGSVSFSLGMVLLTLAGTFTKVFLNDSRTKGDAWAYWMSLTIMGFLFVLFGELASPFGNPLSLAKIGLVLNVLILFLYVGLYLWTPRFRKPSEMHLPE